jgi:hypothetical protein
MQNNKTYLGKSIYMAAFLMLGCSGTAGGCGSSEGGPTTTVDSELLGVYEIDRYQGSEDGCDQATDIDPAPERLVLYSFLPNDNPDEARLGGTFCGSVDDCRGVAKAAGAPTIGYSFWQGSDEAGWFGWGISSAGAANDQCRADVQALVLTSTSAEAIGIETRTVETEFPPFPPMPEEGNTVTCRNADALASLNPDLPCKAIIVLEATHRAGL